MTLRSRITLWFTIWMAIMLTLIVILIVSASDFLSEREMEEELSEAVEEAAEDPYDADIYDDGVFISVYSRSGELIKGRDIFPFYSYPVNEGAFRNATKEGHEYLMLDQSSHGFIIRGCIRLTTLGSIFSTSSYFLLPILPLLLILSAIGGYIIVSRSTKSLYRMTETADLIAESEDLALRMDADSCHEPEVKALAQSFNKMLTRLEEAFIREKQFTSDASHELRTPLSVIRAESEYALTVLDDREETESSLAVIHTESVRMSDMLSQLLTLARTESGSSTLKRETTDLSLITEEVISTLCREAQEKGQTISKEITEDVLVKGDPLLLSRLVTNLISNAIRYTPSGGHIGLLLKKEGSKAILEVKDDGIGISEKDIPHIFERFYQADSSHTIQGAGLGLSLAKNIVLLHGGTIACKSCLGEGSVFTVTLEAIDASKG